ncbi:MAG: polyketide synthase, partial [Arenicella sp.]|nr:polyketide synthase [Arenicella sp.]
MNKPTSDAENTDVKKELARFIIEQVRDKRLAKGKAAEFLAELSKKVATKTEVPSDDVAIIGMACQFPDASNKEEFWHNLVNGHNAIDDFPDQRRADLAALDNNETELFKGGFLSSVDRFDNEYFNIPPNVARHMDPYQRLLMQSLVEAIEDAGYSKSQVYGKKIGVFVGNDHTHRFFNNYISFIDDIDFNSVAGSWTAVLASRLSYLFNLKGPALVIDTACSSGLVALDSAVKAIQNGDCESALVSAANLFFAPGKGLVGEIENDDFMVRAFDQGASGTVWGEGIASILIKPLTKAKEDGDAIYGVVKGIAINNDGASNGLTAPNAKAQEEVIKSAWQKANINPEAVSYIETHGTGTKLGDPIEIKGLVNAFRSITKKKQFCGIGSVKTNIGHTVGVAGLASLIKVLLSFRYKQLPPSINFHAPNPFIDFANSPVYINDHLSDWSSNEILTAGISSFSLSGTNCHLVIQEAPTQSKRPGNFKLPVRMLPLSARSHELLIETVA